MMNKKFTKIIIGEIVVLGLVLLASRFFIFPAIAGIKMLHVQISVHTFMIGVCATVFTIMGLVAKKKLKTHKKYIVIPVIFTIFGYFMQIIAREISIL